MQLWSASTWKHVCLRSLCSFNLRSGCQTSVPGRLCILSPPPMAHASLKPNPAQSDDALWVSEKRSFMQPHSVPGLSAEPRGHGLRQDRKTSVSVRPCNLNLRHGRQASVPGRLCILGPSAVARASSTPSPAQSDDALWVSKKDILHAPPVHPWPIV